MAEIDYPAFNRLATDGDESRWLADQAALRRQIAARKARGLSQRSSNTPVADAPIRARIPPALIGGGLFLAAAVIFLVTVWLQYIEPALVTPKAAPKPTRSAPAAAPVATGSSLPCYVGGVSLGVLPLVDCAEREGQAMDRLQAQRDRPRTRAVPDTRGLSRPRQERATALKLSTPARPRPSPTPPFQMRVASLPPRVATPLRPAPAPSPAKSPSLGDRLDDAALATVDARREASRGGPSQRPSRSFGIEAALLPPG